MSPVLGYWDVKGLAETIRLLLHYLEVEFEDKRYQFGTDPKEIEWFKKKQSLGLDFPNLPYYIDDDIKLTQSGAILRYIADKYEMIPQCKKQQAILQMIQNDVVDIRIKFATACFNPDIEKMRPELLETLHQRLSCYDDFLSDKEWLMGEKINYPDFNLCELLIWLEKFEPALFDKHPKLKAYMRRFQSLPTLKAYLTSDDFKSRPIFGPKSYWR